MTESLLQFGGRLHPLLLHLPIGAFAALVLLEIAALVRRRPLDRGVRVLLVWVIALSSVITAVAGLLLSRESSYSDDALSTHKWLGIAVAILAILWVVLIRTNGTKAHLLMLTIVGAALVPAGHFGSGITHGPDFLTEPFRKSPVTTAFDNEIAPIFAARCVSCHSDSKRKGGLSLETADAIRAGGKHGAVIKPSDVEQSEIAIRLRLPIDDKRHMPPKGRSQPTPEEIETITQWIADGASLDSGGESMASGDASVVQPQHSDRPSTQSLDALRARQVHVEPSDPATGALWIDFSTSRAIADADIATLLAPLTNHVVDLSLANTGATDSLLDTVAAMKSLQRLNLSGTKCSASALGKLAALPKLEELRLVRTNLDDSAVDSLATLPALNRLYLWRSGLSADAIKRLRELKPDIVIDDGSTPSTAPIETEPPLAFSGDAPVASAAGASETLSPVNATCPVTGKPIDLSIVVVHQKRPVGFCCPKCPAQFWENPAKFPVQK